VGVVQLLVGLCRVPKGAGAPCNNWLHDVFTYLFADGFSGIYLNLPDAMNVLEAFSNLASLTEVMEKVTELTGDFYEADPSAFYEEASRLGSISLAFSLLKAIAIAANLIVSLKGNLGVPMNEVGNMLKAGTLDITNAKDLGYIDESGQAVLAMTNDHAFWVHLSADMKKHPDVLRELLNREELYLYDKYIGDVGAASIAEGLRTDATCKKLNLEYNSITDAGASKLAEAVAVNSTLEKLSLGNNRITDVGASKLAEAVFVNNTLEKLSLDNNQITDAEALKFFQDLGRTKHLGDTIP